MASTGVSSRAPVRGHLAPGLGRGQDYLVSSRAPVRGHPVVKPSDCVIKWCFKSCPREGASLRLCRLDDARAVSSRAPVRGHQVTRKEEPG